MVVAFVRDFPFLHAYAECTKPTVATCIGTCRLCCTVGLYCVDPLAWDHLQYALYGVPLF